MVAMDYSDLIAPCALVVLGVVGYVVYTTLRGPTQSDVRGVNNAAAGAEMEEDMSKPSLKILFGSQTGSAETFAKTLVQEGKTIGFRSEAVDLLDYEPEDLQDESCVVFVVATYGEGEPTDSARDFYEWFNEQNKETCDLSNVNYSIFGLGDTQYKHFNECSKDTERLMTLCGGNQLYVTGQGDADKDLEEDFENWKQDLWPALTKFYDIKYEGGDNFDFERTTRLEYDPNSSTPFDPYPYKKRLEIGQKNPVWATVTCNRELLGDSTERSTRHIELSLDGFDLYYEAGDHLGVYAPNDDTLVDQYISRLSSVSDTPFAQVAVKGSQVNMLPAKCNLRQALKWYVDLTYPAKKSVLKAFSQCAQDEQEKEAFMDVLRNNDAAKAEFHKLSPKLRNTFGWLRKFGSAQVPADVFMEHMPHLQPRFYSIASDHKAQPNHIHICVAVEDGGLCTPYLQRMEVGSKVLVFTRTSNFHPPRAPTTPMIMIGPGTGIAPLVGILHRRLALKEKGEELGPCHFFFGCRRREEDFLYEDLLRQCEADGVITALHLAFSRETDRKVYVQHKLAEVGEQVWELLQNGGRVYVCGDARRMARDVEDTLKQIIQTHGGEEMQTMKAVEDYLLKLEKRDRYLKDVWSSAVA
jgi:NADPH-ferrihemoprotein reductase